LGGKKNFLSMVQRRKKREVKAIVQFRESGGDAEGCKKEKAEREGKTNTLLFRIEKGTKHEKKETFLEKRAKKRSYKDALEERP